MKYAIYNHERGICIEISDLAYCNKPFYANLISIPKNACLVSNFDISVKIAPNSQCNITNFKLAFPAYNKIYFIVSAVLVLLLCFIKEVCFIRYKSTATVVISFVFWS